MRVPPELVGRRPVWHLPVAIAMLTIAILSAGIVTSSDLNHALATQSNRITKLQIVVARNSMPLGHLITAADLTLDVRPITGLPEGAITRPEELIGKLTHLPLRDHEVLTSAAVSEPSPSATEAAPPTLEPRDLPTPVVTLPVVQAPTAAVTVPAVIVQAAPPASHPVERTLPPPLPVSPPHAPPVVSPPQLEPARETAALARPARSNARPAVQSPSPTSARHRPFRSYVWVPGQSYSYAVDRKGTVQVVDPSGHRAPLDDYQEVDDSVEGDSPASIPGGTP